MAEKDEVEEEKRDEVEQSPEEYAVLKKKKMIIVIVALVSVLLAIIILVVVIMSGNKSQKTDTENTNEATGAKTEEKLEKSTVKNEAPGEADMRGRAVFYTIRPVFVVNFQQSKRAKFLQVNVDVMARDDNAIDDVIDNLPLIKNDLVKLFSSQTYDQLRTPEGKEDLRLQATKTVQEVLLRETGRPGVEQVLFTQFVMQ